MALSTRIDRGRYRLGLALYARLAGPTQLNAKLRWIMRLERLISFSGLALQCALGVVVGWGAYNWSVANGSPQSQSELLMILSIVVFSILTEVLHRWRKQFQARQGKPELKLGDWISQWLILPLKVIRDERGNAMMAQLTALNLPFHHAFCLLDVEARLLIWLWRGLSAQTLRAGQLNDLLPEVDVAPKPKTRF